MVVSLDHLQRVWLKSDEFEVREFWSSEIGIDSEENYTVDYTETEDVLVTDFAQYEPLKRVFKVISTAIRTCELSDDLSIETLYTLEKIVRVYLKSKWGKPLSDKHKLIMKRRVQNLIFSLPHNLQPLSLKWELFNEQDVPDIAESPKNITDISKAFNCQKSTETTESMVAVSSEQVDFERTQENSPVSVSSSDAAAVMNELFSGGVVINPVLSINNRRPTKHTLEPPLGDVDSILSSTVEGMLQTAQRYAATLEMDKETLAKVTTAAFNYVGKTQSAMAVSKFLGWGSRFSFFQEFLLVLTSLVAFLFMLVFISATTRII